MKSGSCWQLQGRESMTELKGRLPREPQVTLLWERVEPQALLSLTITAVSPTVLQSHDTAETTNALFSVQLSDPNHEQTVMVDFHTATATPTPTPTSPPT